MAASFERNAQSDKWIDITGSAESDQQEVRQRKSPIARGRLAEVDHLVNGKIGP